MMKGRSSGHSIVVALVAVLTLAEFSSAKTFAKPRHCHGEPKHIIVSVGKDPKSEMTINFATKWSQEESGESAVGGVHIGTSADKLDRYVEEQELPLKYISFYDNGTPYHSPYQHHITVDGLEPGTTYYYKIALRKRHKGPTAVRVEPIHDQPSSQHVHGSAFAEANILSEEQLNDKEEGLTRRLALVPYDGSDKPCPDVNLVRKFTTAPPANKDQPVSFAIIGDLGQFDHSRETLEHMTRHKDEFDAVMLVGDLAYTDYHHGRWDTFGDFLDDYSCFDEKPLQIATGNHDIDKIDGHNEIFQAYETRFRMPRIRPAELGVYDGPKGLMNMDVPPYPLPYEYGNAYYSFEYGPAKHIVISAYSSMEPESAQYDWLLEEFASVNREVTPWLLVSIHVPIYSTFSLHQHDLQIFAAREHLEPLFMDNRVNMVFTGHIHAYQRTSNVYKEELVPAAPIHVTIGAGGRQCDAPFRNEEPEDWVMSRDASFYGYGMFSITNHTHAEWRWIPLAHSDLGYNYVVQHKDEHLKGLQHDVLVVENQFFG